MNDIYVTAREKYDIGIPAGGGDMTLFIRPTSAA